MGELASRLALHRDGEMLFDAYGVEGEIEQALGARVRLPSGGEIVLEGTEALTAVDVNTGSHVGESRAEDTAMRTNLEAPTYRLYAVDPEQPQRERWREIVPPRPDAVLEGFQVARHHLALSYLERASARLRLTDLEGGGLRGLSLPTLGTLFGASAEWDGEELFYGFHSPTVPPRAYRVDLATGSEELWLGVDADVDPSRFEVRQVSVRSRDGTEITMFLVHRTGLVRDGRNPVYLTGYGGFNISMTPVFSRSQLLWLEAGGVVATPNIRGGGEYGERWHQEGMLGRKQNSFDDFIAAAEWLIAEGYTTPARLAAQGGSNGGLLMGAVLTQRPDLFRAVVVQVPLLDMLRYEKFGLGEYWSGEYGTAADPVEFGWLRAYSPYHNVRPGTAYPAVLFTVFEGDTRVDPMHARKMCALLQEATAGPGPILLRREVGVGHSTRSVSRDVALAADQLSFLASCLW